MATRLAVSSKAASSDCNQTDLDLFGKAIHARQTSCFTQEPIDLGIGACNAARHVSAFRPAELSTKNSGEHRLERGAARETSCTTFVTAKIAKPDVAVETMAWF